MTRVIPPAVLTAVRDARGEQVHLIELEFSGGVERITTGSRNLTWNGFTWIAVGGSLMVGPVEETEDMRGQGLELVLSGVDQVIVSDLLNNQWRGRAMRAWRAYLDQTTGAVLADPLLLFDGLQLEGYEVEEVVERGKQATVTIRTRGKPRMALDELRGIRATLHSHQHYFPGDTFFRHVPSVEERLRNGMYWGGPAPARIIVGGGGGGRGGSGGDSDDKRVR